MMQELYTDTSSEIKNYPPQELSLGERQTMKVRDDRIDAIKFWLIVLVITVHVLNRKEFADSTACAVVWKWCSIFAMPLFIFISGYFSGKKEKKNFLLSIWKLFEPLVIFQIIALLFYVDSVSIGKILKPWFLLWYLLSLIYWRLILQIIPDKILRHKKIIIIGAFCLSILAGFLPLGRFLSLQRTLAYMPFFFLGYCMKGRNIYLPDKYIPLCITFLVSVFVIPLYFPLYLGDLTLAAPYHNVYGAMQRMFIFTLAIPMSIAFLNVCYNTPWIARQGRLSIYYYIYHALILFPLMNVVGNMDISMPFITATIITIGITLGVGVLLKLPYIKELTNPSIFIRKNET